MLKILNYRFNSCENVKSGSLLFDMNPIIRFDIYAPMYWWLDTDWVKYGQSLPLSDFNFCLDEWQENSPYIREMKMVLENAELEPRRLMQILPLSTYLGGTIELTYREVVEVCENYRAGEYIYTKPYSFPTEKEWTDFCETLLALTGISDLV